MRSVHSNTERRLTIDLPFHRFGIGQEIRYAVGIERRYHRLHALRQDAGQSASRWQRASGTIRELEAFLGAAHDSAEGDFIRWLGGAHAAGTAANGFNEAVVRSRRL